MIPYEEQPGDLDRDSETASGNLAFPSRQDLLRPNLRPGKVIENFSTAAASLLELWDGGRGGDGSGDLEGVPNATLSPFGALCNEEHDPFCMFSSGLDPGGGSLGNVSTPVAAAFNLTSSPAIERKYWTLVLVVFPVVTVFGNVLVVMSVAREKSLKTVTNYFICSLAVADIMVAVVVMPFGVYVEVVNGWWLSDGLCDAWVASDVMACTASILNLTAISVDRFIAVTQPIKYAKHKNSKRVYIMIALTWLISVAIAMPISLGVNYTPHRVKGDCAFYNADFIIYSSMGSFYIPSLIMIFLYGKIYRVIRQRAQKASAAKRHAVDSLAVRNVIENVGAAPVVLGTGGNGTVATSGVADLEPTVTTGLAPVDNGRVTSYNTTTITHAHHLSPLQLVEETSVSNMPSDSPEDDDEEEEEEGEDQHAHSSTSPTHDNLPERDPPPSLVDGDLGAELISNPIAAAAEQREAGTTICSSSGFGSFVDTAIVSETRFTSLPTCMVRKKVGKGKNNGAAGARPPSSRHKKGITKFHFHMRTSRKRKEKSSSRREKKATKTLAIVLGVFLLCWVPFFTINNVNAICIRYDLLEYPACNPAKMIISFFVWLGYINSFLNPVIYTIFNPEFRKAFKKILTEPCCWRR